MTEMQTGEVLRREVFNLLDAAKGGRLNQSDRSLLKVRLMKKLRG